MQATKHKESSCSCTIYFIFLFVSIFHLKQTCPSSKSSSNAVSFSCFGLTLEWICQPKTTTSCGYWFLQNPSWSDQTPGHRAGGKIKKPKKEVPLTLSCGIACSAHTTNLAKLLNNILWRLQKTAKVYSPSQGAREFIQVSSCPTSFRLDSALFWNKNIL